jgi:metal-dependent amidase/aminoacylase/carboxypeptidase family protein
MKAEPGAPNVIAGRVEFPYELRDPNATKIEHMRDRAQQHFAEIPSQTRWPVCRALPPHTTRRLILADHALLNMPVIGQSSGME